ncbi:hypothetical protein Tsubulata_016726 [Turnera subulata]|uniref:Epidermal patterning factor-like protein n=1 Tax=Turnera subulata TaxID=218843 RepID=A0A9Q0JLF8_9ROSI|nr:hypothetical protein Tsubulata_016726 [Turnera subulata]
MKFLIGAHMSFLFVLIFLAFIVGKSLRPHDQYTRASFHNEDASNGIAGHVHPKEEAKEELGMELYPTGSSLPDCSHACGPCSPCKRVMVSFKCSTAESCPIVYRCMCKGKYYHVPSA